jgi:hypothetical protein
LDPLDDGTWFQGLKVAPNTIKDLARCRNLKDLHVRTECWESVADAICQQVCVISKLSLLKMKVTERYCEDLANTLKINTSIDSVVLTSSCAFDNAMAIHLSKALLRSNSEKYLELHRGGSGVFSSFDMLEKAPPFRRGVL